MSHHDAHEPRARRDPALVASELFTQLVQFIQMVSIRRQYARSMPNHENPVQLLLDFFLWMRSFKGTPTCLAQLPKLRTRVQSRRPLQLTLTPLTGPRSPLNRVEANKVRYGYQYAPLAP